jgi:hypothetical protein
VSRATTEGFAADSYSSNCFREVLEWVNELAAGSLFLLTVLGWMETVICTIFFNNLVKFVKSITQESLMFDIRITHTHTHCICNRALYKDEDGRHLGCSAV